MAVGLEAIDPPQATRDAIAALGLSGIDVGLDSPEAMAELLRRTASFACPTSPARLARMVKDVWSDLPGFTDEAQGGIENALETLVAYGDLLELPVDEGTVKSRQLFLGPPAFVVLRPDSALILGVRPEGSSIVADALLGMIEHTGHARLIDVPSAGELLTAEGLIELAAEQWLRAPRQTSAEELVSDHLTRLSAAGPSGDIAGLQVIDPASSVSYYRGRWRGLSPRDDGHFVARRPQAFGADIWCFVQVIGGSTARVLDLPVDDPLRPGPDDAWRLQAALDTLAGYPQFVRVQSGTTASLIHFFSPVPSWLRRRLDIVGKAGDRRAGALFTYSLPTESVAVEVQYLSQMMWLAVRELGGSDRAA